MSNEKAIEPYRFSHISLSESDLTSIDLTPCSVPEEIREMAQQARMVLTVIDGISVGNWADSTMLPVGDVFFLASLATSLFAAERDYTHAKIRELEQSPPEGFNLPSGWQEEMRAEGIGENRLYEYIVRDDILKEINERWAGQLTAEPRLIQPHAVMAAYSLILIDRAIAALESDKARDAALLLAECALSLADAVGLASRTSDYVVYKTQMQRTSKKRSYAANVRNAKYKKFKSAVLNEFEKRKRTKKYRTRDDAVSDLEPFANPIAVELGIIKEGGEVGVTIAEYLRPWREMKQLK